MNSPSFQGVQSAIAAKAESYLNDDRAARLWAAEDLLEEAARLIAELLTKPHDEILDHSAREFLAQFETPPPNPPPPCGPSAASVSSPDSSPGLPSDSSPAQSLPAAA